MKVPVKYLFKLDPYDAAGKAVVTLMRKSLSPDYRLVLRGRGPNRKGRQSLPLDEAAWVAVYIFRKDDRIQDTTFPTEDEVKSTAAERKVRDLLDDQANRGGSLGDLLEGMGKQSSV